MHFSKQGLLIGLSIEAFVVLALILLMLKYATPYPNELYLFLTGHDHETVSSSVELGAGPPPPWGGVPCSLFQVSLKFKNSVTPSYRIDSALVIDANTESRLSFSSDSASISKFASASIDLQGVWCLDEPEAGGKHFKVLFDNRRFLVQVFTNRGVSAHRIQHYYRRAKGKLYEDGNEVPMFPYPY